MNPVEKTAPIPGKLPQPLPKPPVKRQTDDSERPDFRKMLEEALAKEPPKKRLSTQDLRRLIRRAL